MGKRKPQTSSDVTNSDTLLSAAVSADIFKVFQFLQRPELPFEEIAHALVSAAGCGQLDVVKAIASSSVASLGNKHVVHALDRDGYYALARAAEKGQIEVARWLVWKRSYPDQMTLCGWNACGIAAREGHVDVLRYLANVTKEYTLQVASPDGLSCFMIAIKYGQPGVVKWLLESHKAFLSTNKDYLDFLTSSCSPKQAQLEMTQLFIDRGIVFDVSSIASLIRNQGRKEHWADVIHIMSSKGCPSRCNVVCAAASQGKLGLVQLLTAHGECSVNHLSTVGWNCVVHACAEKQLETVKYLLRDFGANMITSDLQYSALVSAAESGSTSTVKYLLESTIGFVGGTNSIRGIDSNRSDADCDSISSVNSGTLENRLNSSMSSSSSSSSSSNSNVNRNVYKFLNVDRRSIDFVDAAGWTAITIAIKKDHHSIVKLLIEHQADCGEVPSLQITPLALAIENNSLETVKLLLENMNVSFPKYPLPKMYEHAFEKLSTAGNIFEMIKYLVEREYIKVHEPLFPVHLHVLTFACTVGQYELVEWLLKKNNAEIKKQLLEGPLLDVALQNGHLQIVRFLVFNSCKMMRLPFINDLPVRAILIEALQKAVVKKSRQALTKWLASDVLDLVVSYCSNIWGDVLELLAR